MAHWIKGVVMAMIPYPFSSMEDRPCDSLWEDYRFRPLEEGSVTRVAADRASIR